MDKFFKHTPEQKALALSLRVSGKSLKETAELTGLNEAIIRYYCGKNQITLNTEQRATNNRQTHSQPLSIPSK